MRVPSNTPEDECRRLESLLVGKTIRRVTIRCLEGDEHLLPDLCAIEFDDDTELRVEAIEDGAVAAVPTLYRVKGDYLWHVAGVCRDDVHEEIPCG